ncbi:hypothetical protein BDA99DRAFT_503140 [Phascolomyces articulosus]|uniref:Uncharacterized protein n=1 Tax=Phascolomyces articulosus TaxID=60185 RepID=A0AAD5K4T6_9FUNG|nr:hypothetical protein BDA99DRAFT_503140 [Phascolomyces articulosus]
MHSILYRASFFLFYFVQKIPLPFFLFSLCKYLSLKHTHTLIYKKKSQIISFIPSYHHYYYY